MVALTSLLPPWVRRKIVERAEASSRFLVCCVLAYCLWPSRLDNVINAHLDLSAGKEVREEQLASLTEAGALQPAPFEQGDEDEKRTTAPWQPPSAPGGGAEEMKSCVEAS